MAARRPPRAAVRAAVRACLGDLEPGERVVVALSGGADSLALTAAAVAVGAELGLLCEAVVIDHGLQRGSGEIAARAAEQARILGCAGARVVTVEVPRGAGSGGLEAAARTARYAALEAVAGVRAPIPEEPPVGATPPQPEPSPVVTTQPSPTGSIGTESPGVPPTAAILLGHTREDQAETVLLGLARGSGTRSLAGMAGRTGIYRRPLLDLPREVVVAAAREAATADPRLEPWTDPHNADPGFARVRVREDLLPVLEAALGPGTIEALARTATLAREDADALDAWADRVWARARGRSARPAHHTGSSSGEPCGLLTLEGHEAAWITDPSSVAGAAPPSGGPSPTVLPTDVGPFDALTSQGEVLPPAIVHRVVRRFLVEAGCPRGALTAGHIRAVAALLDRAGPPRAEVALPGGRRARREAGAVVVRV